MQSNAPSGLTAALPHRRALDWSVCIPTLNRVDVLELALKCILAQTHLPKEVVVVDASDDWEGHRDRLAPLFDGTPIDFALLPAEERSSAVQRNQGLARATGDVVLFIDDDTLMFEDCAERLMATYASDTDQRIAAIGMTHVGTLPAEAQAAAKDGAPAIARKAAGRAAAAKQLLTANRLTNFIRRDVLMMAMDRMFVPYDKPSQRYPGSVPDGWFGVSHLPGYGMSVRLGVAGREPFNSELLAYCPFEDLDASYRWGRHGLCLMQGDARVHHYEVASSRVTRLQATMLGITNMAFFMRSGDAAAPAHQARFVIYALRRAFGETIKDALTGRLRFPQARGALAAVPVGLRILSMPQDDLREWYRDRQRQILKRKSRAS